MRIGKYKLTDANELLAWPWTGFRKTRCEPKPLGAWLARRTVPMPSNSGCLLISTLATGTKYPGAEATRPSAHSVERGSAKRRQVPQRLTLGPMFF